MKESSNSNKQKFKDAHNVIRTLDITDSTISRERNRRGPRAITNSEEELKQVTRGLRRVRSTYKNRLDKAYYGDMSTFHAAEVLKTRTARKEREGGTRPPKKSRTT